MAIRLGKYNTFLSSLQKALEGRRISETSELTTMDEQRLSLAPVTKNKTKHVNQFNKIAKNKKSAELNKFETEYAAFIANLKAEQNKQPVITEPVTEPIISVIEQPNESTVETLDEATSNLDVVETATDTVINITETINSEEVPTVIVEELQQDAPVKTRKKKTKVVDKTVVEEKPAPEEPTMSDFMFD